MKRILSTVLVILAGTLALHAQEAPRKASSLKLGVKCTSHYNYKVLHTVAAVTIDFNNNSVFAGPSCNHYFAALYDFDNTIRFERSGWGLNIGYRRVFPLTGRKPIFFVQTDVSVYPTKLEYYQMGLAGWVASNDWFFEHTVVMGLNIPLCERISLSSGVGFGSTDYFFLMIDHVVPSLIFSLEFK